MELYVYTEWVPSDDADARKKWVSKIVMRCNLKKGRLGGVGLLDGMLDGMYVYEC